MLITPFKKKKKTTEQILMALRVTWMENVALATHLLKLWSISKWILNHRQFGHQLFINNSLS